MSLNIERKKVVRRSTSLLRLQTLGLVKGPASESEHNIQRESNKLKEVIY